MKTGIGKEFTKEDRKNRTIYIPQMLSAILVMITAILPFLSLVSS